MAKYEFLNLGRQPLANRLVTDVTQPEFTYELKAYFDEETRHITTTALNIPSEAMFNSEYPYRSGQSETFKIHLEDVASIMQDLVINPTKFQFLEIGSNDGSLIKHLPKERTLAVEPCKNFAEQTGSMGYRTYIDFWGLPLAERIISSYGRVSVIFSANTFSHMPNLEEAFKAIELVLDREGVFILEDPYIIDVLTNGSYDQFYDEHPTVFSVTALDYLLKNTNLQIHKVVRLPNIHGGSIRVFIGHKNSKTWKQNDIVRKTIQFETAFLNNSSLYAFAERVRSSKIQLKEAMVYLKTQGKKIVGYGASAKSITVINYCGLHNLIDCVYDTTPEKVGKFTPGIHIPIKQYTTEWEGDVAFLGAWNFEKEIINKEYTRIKEGSAFITHVPSVRLIYE